MAVTVIIDKQTYPSHIDTFEDDAANLYQFLLTGAALKILRLNPDGFGKPRLECHYNMRHVISVSGSLFVPQREAIKNVEFE